MGSGGGEVLGGWGKRGEGSGLGRVTQEGRGEGSQQSEDWESVTG